MSTSNDPGLFYTFYDGAKNDGGEGVEVAQTNQENEAVPEKKGENEIKESPKEPLQSGGMQLNYSPRFGVRVPRLNFIYSGKTKTKQPEEPQIPAKTTEKAPAPPVPQPPKSSRPRFRKSKSHVESPAPDAATKRPHTTRRARVVIIKKPQIKYVPPPKPSKKEVKQSKLAKEVLRNPMALPASADDLSLLISRLREEYNNALYEQKWDEAVDVARIINHAVTKQKIAVKKKETNRYFNEVTRHNELCVVAKSKVDEWNETYDAFQNNIQMRANEICASCQKELDDFDKTSPQELPPHYMKASQQLRKLRDQEKMYALQLNFEAANATKVLADQREIREEIAAIDLARNDFYKKRNNLIKKHERRLNAFVMRAQATQFAMLKNRETFTSGYCKRIVLLGDDIVRHIEKGEVHPKELKNATIPPERTGELAIRKDSTPLNTQRIRMV